MTPSHTDTLCTKCGLCCDGTLFADVELSGRAEATRLEAMGLEIEDGDAGGALLVQPCAALRGRRCSVYAHRPKCCRTFECKLLQSVRRGAETVERAGELIADALSRIGRVRELLAGLGERDGRLPLRERCAELIAEDAGSDPLAERRRAELAAEMAGLEKVVKRTFLG